VVLINRGLNTKKILECQLHDRTLSTSLLDKLGIPDIIDFSELVAYVGMVIFMRSSASIKNIHELPLPARGRPLKFWISCVNHDIKELKLTRADPLNK